MDKQRITVQVLNGATGETREVVANVAAKSEQAADWYHASLTEQERRDIVGGIRYSTEYGVTVTFARLPEAAQQAVLSAYLLANRIDV